MTELMTYTVETKPSLKNSGIVHIQFNHAHTQWVTFDNIVDIAFNI